MVKLDSSAKVTVIYAVVPTAELSKVKFPKQSYASGIDGYTFGELLDRGVTMRLGQRIMVELHKLTKSLFPGLEPPAPSLIMSPEDARQ